MCSLTYACIITIEYGFSLMLEDVFLLMHDTRVCEILWFQQCQREIFVVPVHVLE